MSVSAGYKIFLAVGMLVSGSINTISIKTADLVNATGRSDFKPHPFTHPYMQCFAVFLGELGCLLVYCFIQFYLHCLQSNRFRLANTERRISCNPLVFILPAFCDMFASSTIFLGLNFTYASSFQMLRGSVVIFTSILSIVMLHRKIFKHQWLGVSFTVFGLAIVGLADLLFSDHASMKTSSILMGDGLIILAQVVTACQMVLEEKYVVESVHPLQAIGWEGFWGTIMLGSLLWPLSHIYVGPVLAPNTPNYMLEDVVDGFYQIKNNDTILYATLGSMVSIACFNMFGISVTKHMAATTRMVVGSLRVVGVWAYSLIVGWQHFIPLQIAGFIVLMVGMAWYNKILLPSALHPSPSPVQNDPDSVDRETAVIDEDEPLLHD